MLASSFIAREESCQIKTECFELFVADVFDVCRFRGQEGKQGLRDVEPSAHLSDHPCAGPSGSLLNQGNVAMTYFRLSSQFALFYSRDRTRDSQRFSVVHHIPGGLFLKPIAGCRRRSRITASVNQ